MHSPVSPPGSIHLLLNESFGDKPSDNDLVVRVEGVKMYRTPANLTTYHCPSKKSLMVQRK